MSDENAQPDFESALTQLEDLVGKMEAGELTLEQSLDHFQQGVTLYKGCQKALDDAQLKVQQLLDVDDDPSDAVSFDADQ